MDDFLREAPPESLNLELKSALSAKGGQADPWMTGASSIGDKARNGLLEEVVAFANAEGGTLVLGIQETQTRPARPSSKSPLPRCCDLAERLRLQARDCIEPPLPMIDSVGISLDPSGDGIVVVRVPRSKVAPHRLIPTGGCYVRRNDRTEKLTMREIQELVLARAYEERSLDSVFETRRSKLPKMSLVPTRTPLQITRVTLLPAGARLFLDQIYQREDIKPLDQNWSARLGEEPIRLVLPDLETVRRPILRGVLHESGDEPLRLVQEIGSNGLVEFQLRQTIKSDEHDRVFPESALALALNALGTADRFRRAAGAPDVEYALELEILKTWEAPRLNRFGGQVRQIQRSESCTRILCSCLASVLVLSSSFLGFFRSSTKISSMQRGV